MVKSAAGDLPLLCPSNDPND